jgi:hypothetical protein
MPSTGIIIGITVAVIAALQPLQCFFTCRDECRK